MTADYPGSKNHQMWCEKRLLSSGNGDLDAQLRRSGQLMWVRNGALFYLNVPAKRGESGWPVWILNGGRRYLIGVATEADGGSTIAVLVNDAVRRQLRDWMSSTVRRRAESLVEESETGAVFEQKTPPPAGVPLFEHFYQPMTADAAGTETTGRITTCPGSFFRSFRLAEHPAYEGISPRERANWFI